MIGVFASSRLGHPPSEGLLEVLAAALSSRGSSRHHRARELIGFDPCLERPPGYFAALWSMILASVATELKPSFAAALGFDFKQALCWLPAFRCYPHRWDSLFSIFLFLFLFSL